MNIINPMKNLYIATIGEDFARWVKKTQSGLELDQFCMAENLDEPKYESCCKGIMDIHDLLQQAKELCKPDTTYTVEVIHCGKAMEWLENQKTLRILCTIK